APLNFIVEIEGSSAFFIRIEKNADIIEMHVPDEGADLVEIGVGFAWKADDKRGPEAGSRHEFSNAVNLTLVHGAVPAALHALEHEPARMLVRDIEVFAEALLFSNQSDQFIRNHVRVAIQKTNPLESIDLTEFTKQRCDAVSKPDIRPVSHGVLRDDDQFPNTLLRQSPRFSD